MFGMSGFTVETNIGNQPRNLTWHLAHAVQERSSMGTNRSPGARESRWNLSVPPQVCRYLQKGFGLPWAIEPIVSRSPKCKG